MIGLELARQALQLPFGDRDIVAVIGALQLRLHPAVHRFEYSDVSYPGTQSPTRSGLARAVCLAATTWVRHSQIGLWFEWGGGRGGSNVTLPASQYSLNGERRSFAPLPLFLIQRGRRILWDSILDLYSGWESDQERVSHTLLRPDDRSRHAFTLYTRVTAVGMQAAVMSHRTGQRFLVNGASEDFGTAPITLTC